jgi:hypothetical protein
VRIDVIIAPTARKEVRAQVISVRHISKSFGTDCAARHRLHN